MLGGQTGEQTSRSSAKKRPVLSFRFTVQHRGHEGEMCISIQGMHFIIHANVLQVAAILLLTSYKFIGKMSQNMRI